MLAPTQLLLALVTTLPFFPWLVTPLVVLCCALPRCTCTCSWLILEPPAQNEHSEGQRYAKDEDEDEDELSFFIVSRFDFDCLSSVLTVQLTVTTLIAT